MMLAWTFRVGSIAALSLIASMISRSDTVQPIVGAQGSVMQAFTSAFEGTWDIRVTGPNLSSTAMHEGDEVWSFELGGVPFVERYHSKGVNGDDYDVGYFWWNSVTSTIDGSFCMSSIEQGCTPFHVQWENNRAVMDGEYLSKGKVITWHEVFALSDKDSFTQTLNIREAGTEMRRVAVISAKRHKK